MFMGDSLFVFVTLVDRLAGWLDGLLSLPDWLTNWRLIGLADGKLAD